MTLKSLLCKTHILSLPEAFVVYSDVIYVGFGCVLMQR